METALLTGMSENAIWEPEYLRELTTKMKVRPSRPPLRLASWAGFIYAFTSAATMKQQHANANRCTSGTTYDPQEKLARRGRAP